MINMAPYPIATVRSVIIVADQSFFKAVNLKNQMEDKGHPPNEYYHSLLGSPKYKAATYHNSTTKVFEDISTKTF